MNDHCGSRINDCHNRDAAIYARCGCDCDPCSRRKTADRQQSMAVELGDSRRLFNEHKADCLPCQEVDHLEDSRLCETGQEFWDSYAWCLKKQQEDEIEQDS